MSEETPITKALKDILDSQSFDRLGSFTEQEVLTSMSTDEKDLLAKLFVVAAEAELKHPKSEDPIATAKKSFAMASSLSPLDAAIWYRRGVAFSSQEAQELLEEGSLCFEKALSINENYFDALHGWGNVLLRRGVQLQESNFFLQAQEKFAKAESLLADPEECGEFFWHYGLSYFMMGRYSGEAIDLHQALQQYRKAKSYGLKRLDFFNDFANALVELSLLLNSQDMMFEAIELYLYSLDQELEKDAKSREIAIRYCNLGACYQYLFEFHHEDTFFKQAEECFSQAVELHPNFGNAWAFWGYLLLYAAKMWQDAHYLEGSLEKFQHVVEFAQDKPMLLARMAEAYALFGSHREDLKYLTDAEEIALRAVESGPDLPYSWAAVGLVNLELGRYFGDESYYHKAIEKVEKGLNLNQRIGISWHVLAVAKFSLGESTGDLQLIEEALFAFLNASKTDIGRFGYMWNDWGIALLNLADITHEPKFIQEAIDKFEQGILLHEQVHPTWLVNYGSALDFWGDLTENESFYEKAIEVLTHATALDPTSVQARYHLGLAHCHLGELNEDLNQLQKAIVQLQSVINDDMEDDAALNDLGMAYLYVAELTHESVDQSRTDRDRDDQDSTDQDLTDIQVKNSLYDLAEQHFLQALSLGNQHAYYNIACLYSLNGNLADSMAYLQKAHETHTLPPLIDVLEDEWLENVRNTLTFSVLVEQMRKSHEAKSEIDQELNEEFDQDLNFDPDLGLDLTEE